jgi:hypothetical protein
MRRGLFACVVTSNSVGCLSNRRTRIPRRRHASSNLWQKVIHSQWSSAVITYSDNLLFSGSIQLNRAIFVVSDIAMVINMVAHIAMVIIMVLSLAKLSSQMISLMRKLNILNGYGRMEKFSEKLGRIICFHNVRLGQIQKNRGRN